MHTLHLHISDHEAASYNLTGDHDITFQELVEKISLVEARKALAECVAIAEKHGLSAMTLDDINAEIKVVRGAKRHS
jgi:hypothetical protein